MQSLGSKQFWQEYFLSTLLHREGNQESVYVQMLVKEVVTKIRAEILEESKDKF